MPLTGSNMHYFAGKQEDLTWSLSRSTWSHSQCRLQAFSHSKHTSDILASGGIYEHAVVLSVKTEDQDAFERDFFQLKPFYTDTCALIPPSPKEYPILGLNLLRLLAQNRIAEFHTELELLPSTALENPCIKHAVELEQSFMEGAYNRVLSVRQTAPHESYVYFRDLLAKTVRDEIAGCSEKAYDSLLVADAKKILLFTSDQELQDYIAEEHHEWGIKNGYLYFQKARELQPCKDIPSLQLREIYMQNTQNYMYLYREHPNFDIYTQNTNFLNFGFLCLRSKFLKKFVFYM